MYDTGQRQSAKDLEGNLRKVEALYRVAPVDRRDTVSSLLEFEKELGVHHHDPRKAGQVHLKDPSAAIGLLWIRRSLAFQYRLYKRLLENEDVDPRDAAMAAYQKELRPYHSWTLQRIFVIGLKSQVPSRREIIFARLGGFAQEEYGEAEELATKRDLKELLDVWRPIIVRWKEIYNELDLEDKRRV